MNELFVAESDQIAEGQRQFIEHEGQQIAVLRVQGELVAYLNICPHQGGPVCEGMLIHKVVDVLDADRCHQGMRFDENTLHIVCPWHGWEFNARTGVSAGAGNWKLRSFPVQEREGKIYVRIL
ncbi:Rieske (2Fe-2S) protein [Paracandidimonas soli]|uniref:Nitrite reductase/ring-hydroxylating ferredoxin subunit n=1 Tax=Paracandidimonas soli TaxID=1917182 RepID=A0A4R3VG52_9BURK|nr:Rieske (2Fe-2S) protein [Paracandidimonas soli]TCV02772.1 nitrite reductase/ring-hydroxylating ferredoxin subunit [Paracandidimonas soli]